MKASKSDHHGRSSSTLGAPPRVAPAATSARAYAPTEAFAQLYRDLAEQILARREGRCPDPASLLAPGLEDGVRGMRFVSAAVASSRADGRWTAL